MISLERRGLSSQPLNKAQVLSDFPSLCIWQQSWCPLEQWNLGGGGEEEKKQSTKALLCKKCERHLACSSVKGLTLVALYSKKSLPPSSTEGLDLLGSCLLCFCGSSHVYCFSEVRLSGDTMQQQPGWCLALLGLGEIHCGADTFPQQTCLFDANHHQLLTAVSSWHGWMIDPLKAEVRIVSPKRVTWAKCEAEVYLTCWTISNAHFFSGCSSGFPILLF